MLKKLHKYLSRRLLGKGVINFRGKGLLNVIDVGSAGRLPYPWRNNAFKIHHLLKFEPREVSEESASVTALNVALWDGNCEKDFYVYRGMKGSGSSLFEQNYEYVTKHFDELHKRGPKELAEV